MADAGRLGWDIFACDCSATNADMHACNKSAVARFYWRWAGKTGEVGRVQGHRDHLACQCYLRCVRRRHRRRRCHDRVARV
jgi:hypothetical protein